MLENIGERIKAKRIEKEMTLESLAEKVGTGASTVRKWEAGIIKNMRSDKIKKVAEALGVTPAYLMGWEDSWCPKKEITYTVEHDMRGSMAAETSGAYGLSALKLEPLSKEEEELIRIYRILSVRRRMALLTAAINLENEETSK